jgi:hypothetical protein
VWQSTPIAAIAPLNGSSNATRSRMGTEGFMTARV